MIAGSHQYTLQRASECAAWLTDGGVVNGASVRVLSARDKEVVYDVWFRPLPAIADFGYPLEHVRLLVPAFGDPVAVPCGPERTWMHRYSSPVLGQLGLGGRINKSAPMVALVGGLCLWFPGDRPDRRWSWSWGFDAFVRLVRDHLWHEEDARRFGVWPVEDAPHGWPEVRRLSETATGALRRTS